MKLFLIRHAETVDNVANVYAGVRDSALTNHGIIQAERLGRYLAESGPRFTHIFSSDLQRAHKTASAIHAAQPHVEENGSNKKAQVQPLIILREQDFGFYEGKAFFARPQESNRSGKAEHRSQHQGEPNFKDVESKESMATRMDQFLQDHLIPVWRGGSADTDANVAVVSHGIILSHLWRCFLKLFPKQSVSLAPGVIVGVGGVTPLEYLGGWSNTGYLELEVSKSEPTPEETLNTTTVSETTVAQKPGSDLGLQANYGVIIKTVNGKAHLAGLKRTRGVGSSQYDEGQRKIETFFKKRKT